MHFDVCVCVCEIVCAAWVTLLHTAHRKSEEQCEPPGLLANPEPSCQDPATSAKVLHSGGPTVSSEYSDGGA